MNRVLNRRAFLKLAGLGTAGLVWPQGGCCTLSTAKCKRPNIVFIMADDVGQEVLGCYGGTSYKTPNLDKLAKTGTRFTHCFSAPMCVPSRIKIMTGRYGFRNYVRWGYIPPEEVTFGHVLNSAGYPTAISGKWQMILLKEDPHHIAKMGFDKNCVFGWHEGPKYYEPFIYQNGKVRQDVKDRYGPDVFCEFITDFIKRNEDRPFFAYYAMSVAHDISDDLPTPPVTGPLGRYETYKELVENMDKLVGRVVSTLEKLNLRERTLVLFTGDNGTPKKFITKVVDGEYIREPIVSKVGDKLVRGGKGDLTDAGTRVPLIANWPGATPAGVVRDDLIDFSDFLPTFAELAGAKLPEGVTIDGRSFAAQLKGKKGNPRDWAYCHWRGKAWARTHRWKLYEDGRLYDMENDPLEERPILVDADTAKTSGVRKKLEAVFEKLKKS